MNKLNSKQLNQLRDGLRDVIRVRNLDNLTNTSGVIRNTIFVSEVRSVKELIAKSEKIIANFFDGRDLVIKEVDVTFLPYPMSHRVLIECRGKR